MITTGIVWLVSVLLILVAIVLASRFVPYDKYRQDQQDLQARLAATNQRLNEVSTLAQNNAVRIQQLNDDINSLSNTTIRTTGNQTLNGSLTIEQDLTVNGTIYNPTV